MHKIISLFLLFIALPIGAMNKEESPQRSQSTPFVTYPSGSYCLSLPNPFLNSVELVPEYRRFRLPSDSAQQLTHSPAAASQAAKSVSYLDSELQHSPDAYQKLVAAAAASQAAKSEKERIIQIIIQKKQWEGFKDLLADAQNHDAIVQAVAKELDKK